MPKNPNQRSYYIAPALGSAIEEGTNVLGVKHEAQFIRFCICAGLEKLGVTVPADHKIGYEVMKQQLQEGKRKKPAKKKKK